MSNDYYSEEFSGFEHGRASAKQTEDSLKGVQAGFAKLPRERELKENRVNYATATYTSNQVFAVTLPYAIETYTDGLFFAVKMPVANGGSATINVNGVGAKPIKDIQGNTLQANQWAASAIVGLRYTSEGTGHFILQGGGIRGSRGAAGLPGFPFGFDTTTAMADPGAGKFRFNHATPSSVTAIAVDDTDADGSDIAAYIATFDDYGNSTARGHLIVRRPGGADALVFLVTALTDNSGWTQLTVTHVSGSTLPNTTDTYGVSFQPIGVPGATTPVATTSVKGKVELATNDEIDGETGTGSIVPTISGLYRAITRKSITAFSSLTFAASLTWNVGTNPNATITLTGNVTGLTLSGDKDGGVYTLLIKQDTTGSRTFAFPSGWKWAGGSADSIASGASDETLLTIRKVGTDIVAAPLLKDVA